MDELSFHGGRLDVAAARFPHARDWLDLSTGISPFAWPGAGAVPVDLRRLPSPAAVAALCRAAAEAFGAPDATMAALPGSEIGLRLLATLDPPRPWHVVAPCYRTHRAALPGATPIAAGDVPALGDDGGTLLLANPNNPDGRLWGADDLLAIARRLGARGGLLVVDEAFADAVPGASLLPLLAPDDRVLLFRSFGKMYGLAGVRLGFAAGLPDPVAMLADRLGDWPLTAAAIAIGDAAYRDAAWLAAARARVRGMARALDGVLRRHGLEPQGACPLFRLIETPEAPTIFHRLARAGILVRPFEDAPRLLRVGLPGDDAALARLDEALGG